MSVTAQQAARPVRSWRDGVGPALVRLPDRITLGFLAVSVVVALALLVGVFRPYVVLPVGVLAVAGTWRLALPAPRKSAAAGHRAEVLGTLGALVLAVIWYLVQRRYTSEWIGLRRDPSLYTLSALHLVHHASPEVVLDPATVALAHAVPGVWTFFAGPDVTGVNQIQGTSLVPGLMAISGWFAGSRGVLTANVLIGAVALVAVYAAGRRLLGPLWALLPVLGLVLTMPLAAFSRAPYTEPTALILAMGMMAALWVALRRSSVAAYLLAGLFAGAGLMARIDGTVVATGALVGIGAVVVLARTAAARGRALRGLAVFLAGAVPVGLVGWLDLRLHSRQYLDSLGGEFRPTLLVALLVVVVTLVGFAARPLADPVTRWLGRHRRTAGWWVGALALAVAVVMMTRPWWWQAHANPAPGFAQAVEARQAAEGLPVDGTLTYSEESVTWLSWYFGWAMVALASVGAAWAAAWIVRRRDASMLAFAAAPLVCAALYLNRVSITPDQIWAMRRFLPVVIPGLLFAAAFAGRELTAWVRTRARRWTPVLVAAVLVVFILPVLAWGSMFRVTEGVGQYQFVQRLCAAADGGLLVYAGAVPPMGNMLPAFQEACTVPAVFVPHPTVDTLAAVAAHWSGPGPITVVADGAAQLTWTTPPAAPQEQISYTMWESKLSHRPEHHVVERAQGWLGRLQPDGRVQPLG